MNNFWHDILYSLRTMRKSPAFAITAALTLAIGIGGNTAIFTVIRAVLLKPLEYKDPDRLVRLTVDNPRRHTQDSMTLVQFEQLRAAARSFTGIGAFLRSTEDVTISGGGEPETLRGARVSANFLDILGVRPIAGRSFLPEEEPSGARSVAMISSSLWKRRFGGDPNVSGKTITLDSIPCTIIGVLPEGFAFPFAGVDVWVTRPSESSALPPRYWRFVSLLVGFGRLKSGVGMDQARAELNVFQHQFATAHPGPGPGDPDSTMRVVWLKDQLVANVRPMLWMLFGAVGFVLLIACANVASLLLARSASRAREFAVRAAIGASRGRLIRQLLAESLVLAFVGGVLGAFLANGCLILLTRMSAVDLPRAGEIRLDSVVLGFTVALSIVTGVLFGLAPSIGASRPDLIEALRASGEASRAAGGRRGTLGAGARGLLVVGQVALSIVLLIGAALLMESFARLHRVDPGFQASNLLTMKIALPPARYNTPQKRAAFFDELVNRLDSAPAVRGVAMAMSLPATSVMHTNIFIAGRPAPHENEPQMVQMQSITPGYFRTMGIPVRRGREFTARDNAAGAPPAMVINEALARRFWPDYPRGRDPVGQRILEGFDKVAGFQEVIGIVADVHELGLAAGAEAEFYVPNVVHPPQTAYLALRTGGDPMRFVNTARSQTLAIDRDQPISDVRSMDDVLEALLGARRLTLVLLAVFAGVALLLAVVGLYGVIAYSVAQRTQEVGIRRALGAQRGDILRLVLGQGLGLALAGVGLGIGGAFALTRVMEGLLFHISPTDPATFVGIAILFVVVALAASFIPAHRATRIDPMSALR